MKQKMLVFFMIMGLSFGVMADAKKHLDAEKAAIKAAALNYIEGWFEGNKDRMAKALHPALNKVGLRPYRPGGNPVLTPIGYTAMVELANMGVGKKIGKEKANINVKILDVYHNIASVRTTCVQFVDYLLLGKINGEWKIINVLWEPFKK